MSSTSNQTVVVGMSGGVDSSVAALRLKQQGYRVIGLFMKNWDEKDPDGFCPAERDFQDVARVCDRLDIPYYSIEFIEEYWQSVFQDFISDYKAGLTPNPDILCNREIKFDLFLKKALEFGADWVATGHYAQVYHFASHTELHKAVDPTKDQTYFLHAVKAGALDRVLFPIGDLHKKDLRKIAEQAGLPTATKKDSTGICFIGERKFRNFLAQYIPAQTGEFRNLDGKVVGHHRGCAYYTIGQRRGLGLGGEGESWYVVDKDVKKNIVYVERGKNHPALFSKGLLARSLTWINPTRAPQINESGLTAKVRYRQTEQVCFLKAIDSEKLKVEFELPQRAITPGQSVVFYRGTECLGGGIIESVIH
jgi:tRNA-specific 2-thiouridylase